MNILAIGDTHGDSQCICNIAIPQAVKNNCKIIMQVGDLGYWEHFPMGKKFLDVVSRHLVNSDIELFWIDGNHENHPKLWAEYYPSGEFGFVQIRPNLYYVPRGTAWSWYGVKFLGVGGAYSIDKWSRLYDEEQEKMGPGRYWWPTEMLTREDVELAIVNAQEHGPIDVMFTHDAPLHVQVPGIHAEDKWQFPETWVNRGLLTEVFDVVHPKLLVHGHYHTRYTGGIHWQPEDGGPLDGCMVEGLSFNGLSGFAIVLDLEGLFG